VEIRASAASAISGSGESVKSSPFTGMELASFRELFWHLVDLIQDKRNIFS
jgi:hypothetical protein